MNKGLLNPDGWELAFWMEDKIMNRKNVLVRYDKDLRLRIAYPEARKEITQDVVRFIRMAPGMNFVSFTFANEARLDRVIVEQLEYFTPMNQPFTWKVYDHDQLPRLEEKLASHNFATDDDPAAVMVLNVRNATGSPMNPYKIDVRQISDRIGLGDVVYVLDKVYGGKNDWVYDRMGSHLKIPNYLSVYGAYVEDEPASIAWTYFPHGQFAGLFGGTTLPEHRNRGLYTGLLQYRLNEIRQRGFSFAVVEAGAMSKPIVEKHGFQQLTTVWDYEWKAE
ncbi:MAG TPA: hypothetical protein DCX53_01505 [Anaerolineae bacterium]|nr:hypothetical protein [Anaerolineae bacterium]